MDANPRPTKKRQLAAEERQRAVRACAECRRLKEKCEGGMPCKRCQHLRRPCEFSPTTRTAEGGTSINELKERAQCMESIIKHHLPDLDLDLVSLRRTCNSLGSATPRPADDDAAIAPIDPTLAAQPTESPGIEDENCTIDDVDGQTVHYSGEFSHWNYSMHLKRNIDELMKKSNAPTIDHTERVPDFIRVGEADPGSTSIADIIALLPPRPVSMFLMRVFFNHATSFYYYVNRQWLEETVIKIYSAPGGLSSKDVTAACVVLMVLAVGTQYVHLESPKQNGKGASAAPNTRSHSNWELDIGSAFYRQVAKVLSEVIHAGSLLSVQVFLLLGLYSLPLDASGLSYVYLNLAIKLGIQNGMHRKIARSGIDASSKELRRRIWWTAYCMERKIGIYHGRPASIARADIDADLPQSLDGDTFKPAGLLDSIKLTGEAEAFLQEISRLRTCSRSDVGGILNRIKQMKTSLRRRWSPAPSKQTESSSGGTPMPPKTRAELHCKLEICLLHMFIGRPFILAHRQVRAAGRGGAAPLSRTQAAKSQVQWEFLVQDCISAAKEVISICHMMQSGPMCLAKSSYTEYSSCRASLLVLIAYSICYRTNEFSETLQKGLEAIREMASVGESARSEVSLLETLEAALHRLHVFDGGPAEQPIPIETEDTSHEGYEGFLNWYNKLTTPAKARLDDGSAVNDQFDPSIGAMGGSIGSGSATSDFMMDDFPFDFDLLNSNENVAFFTPDFNEHGNPERELFENLLWAPR